MADKPVYMAKPVKEQISRALKQLADTVAPGMNPRRTKNRADVPAEASMNSFDRQTTDSNN
jgi:hypothetical protein